MFYALGKLLIFIILWLDLILATTLMYLLSYLPRKLTQSWYPSWFRHWCFVFIRALGVQLKVHQKNQHPLPKHYILIGNHPSLFEDLGMPALFKAHFLAKAEIRHWWFVGRISFAAGTLYVKRESLESRKHASKALIQTLEAGKNVALYPEGGCKGRRIHLPFRFGPFEAAIKTGVPIIPVFLQYEAQEDFEWNTETVLHKMLLILKSQNKTANYYVFDAIDPKNFDSKEALCHYVETLYLQWQTKYLE
jgi:1-acyl-sn-glycerol-3-phosphate acyltransferase